LSLGLAGCVVDSAGNVVVADRSRIRRVTPAGAVTTIAGAIFPSYANGAGTNAQFSHPQNLVYDRSGNLFVTDVDNAVVRVIAPDGSVVSIGNVSNFAANASAYQDGSALHATFTTPFGIAIDQAGTVYVSDMNESVIRVINVVRVAPASLPSRSRAILGLLALLAMIPLAALGYLVALRARRREEASGKPPAGDYVLTPAPAVSFEAFITDVTLDALLGQGGFASVYSARWCGTRVAAKVLKRSVGAVALRSRGFDSKRSGADAAATAFLSVGVGSEDAEDAIVHEVALLAQLRHPNIVSLYAYVKEPPMLLMEIATGGALSSLLARSSLAELGWHARVEILCGAAHGVEYLHSQSVIHLDLKPANVLLSEGRTPRVSDFGLSMLKNAGQSPLRAGTVMYMAPEVLRGQPVTLLDAVDSYGLGAVCHDTAHVNICAVAEPSLEFSVRRSFLMRGESVVLEQLEESDFAVVVGDNVPLPLAELIRSLLAVDPAARPSARDARVRLEAILAELPAAPARGL